MASSPELSIRAEAMMPLIRERLAAGQTVRNLGFEGVSMLPMLRQGRDSVEIAPPPERFQKYDLPLYQGRDGKYVMHRIVGVRDDHYICLGDNTYHYEKVVPERMVARVCAFYRDGRRIGVDNPGYRLYCRAWCAIYPVRRLIKRVQWRVARLMGKK